MDDVFEFICTYAKENKGNTPSQVIIADSLSLSTSRIQYLMARLEGDGLIKAIPKTYSYKVVDSEWDPPSYVEIP